MAPLATSASRPPIDLPTSCSPHPPATSAGFLRWPVIAMTAPRPPATPAGFLRSPIGLFRPYQSVTPSSQLSICLVQLHLLAPSHRPPASSVGPSVRAGQIGRVIIETATSLRSAREARHSARIIRGRPRPLIGWFRMLSEPLDPAASPMTRSHLSRRAGTQHKNNRSQNSSA